MAKVVVEFRVQINILLQKNEKVFITGSLPEMGSWYPMKSRVLMRQDLSNVNQTEIWGGELSLPLCNIEYRYFIGTIDQNESYDEKSINISTWESHIEPRKLNVLDRVYENVVTLDLYGKIDDHMHVLRGWLTDQTAVQIRVFGDSIKLYQSRLKSKPMFIKCHYFQMNRNHGSQDEEYNHNPLEYCVAKVSKLTDVDCIPHLPPPEGTEYCQDYLTFHVETMDLEDMGIEIEVRQLATDLTSPVPIWSCAVTSQDCEDLPSVAQQEVTPADKYVLVGTARLGLMPAKRAMKSISIYNHINRPIGEIKVDFIAVYPFLGHQYTMDRTYQMHWKHRKTLKVGHKGSGTSYGHTTKMSAVRENTIYSLKHAFHHGADFVEFDVQLSKDMIPVLYHDFKVCTVLRKKRRNDLQFLAVPVKDLTLADLQALKLDHTSAMAQLNSSEIMNMEDVDPTELQPFPTLQDCLEEVDSPLGFNIELKYPQHLISGESEQSNFFDRNVFLDAVLNIVAKFAKNRRIIFSCFDADVCLMLSLKQNKYPTIFLTQGNTTEYEAYKDPRTHSLENALFFVKSCNVLGLSALSTNVTENIDVLSKILEMKLVLFLWGETNNNVDSHQKWISLGVHGIIFDRIHELQERDSLNVFLMTPAINSLVPVSSTRTSEYS